MKKIIIATIVLLFALSVPARAEQIGIHGEAAFRYETADKFPGQSWKIDLHYSFTEQFSIGATETTYTNGYTTYFGAIPSFYPSAQLYEVYAKFNISENSYIKIAQWCNHPVFYGVLDRAETPQGVYVEGSYKF